MTWVTVLFLSLSPYYAPLVPLLFLEHFKHTHALGPLHLLFPLLYLLYTWLIPHVCQVFD